MNRGGGKLALRQDFMGPASLGASISSCSIREIAVKDPISANSGVAVTSRTICSAEKQIHRRTAAVVRLHSKLETCRSMSVVFGGRKARTSSPTHMSQFRWLGEPCTSSPEILKKNCHHAVMNPLHTRNSLECKSERYAVPTQTAKHKASEMRLECLADPTQAA